MEQNEKEICGSFSQINAQLIRINKQNIVPAYEEGAELIKLLNRCRRAYSGNTNKETISQHMKRLEELFISPQSKFVALSTLDIDAERLNVTEYLVRVFSECERLLRSSVSADRHNHVDPFTDSKFILAYLHVINSVDFRCLWRNDAVLAIINATQGARKLISQYVNLESDIASGILAGTEKYVDILDMSYQFAILNIAYDFNTLLDELETSLDWENQNVCELALIECLNKYEAKYEFWMCSSSRYGTHRKKLQAYIISRYLDIFDSLTVIRDLKGANHHLIQVMSTVCSDISQYVSWKKSQPMGSLNTLVEYESLVKRCINFSRMEVRDIYYQNAIKITREILDSVNFDFEQLKDTEIATIARGYQTAFGQAFDLCAEIKDHELMAENVDLYYVMYTELGTHMPCEAKRFLCSATKSTCKLIEELRKRHYSSVSREKWQRADTFFKAVLFEIL